MIRLHHVPFSRSFRVLWLLEEMGLDCEIETYDIRDGSLRDRGFPGLSPAARVPALEIDGIALHESGAIVEYLCETRPEAGLGRAVGHPERPVFLQWVHYAETMASLIEQLNMNHVFLRDPSEASPVVIKLNTARLKGTLAGMEARLGGSDYLLEGGFSGADAMMGFNLFAAPYYVRLDPFPKLRAYREKIEARPAFQRARGRDGEQTFYDRDFYPVPEVKA
ncbi:glutathione S-transferase family protein [Aestuariicoccus sp. MJ-SS9]|uniref:glutathione S-transferase family protein n=1 Tax=Aestuariicoccus sp. MJ-SS9 TaxID=3079855 RepID=UPI00290E643C|nr:glutathione S-transferase family protein [Aestuariicoccus sp. MJ-SS9]MDU8910542.1 glutathione S-transferase family protein [Aestuariicoccus sp. MJ-SS9]